MEPVLLEVNVFPLEPEQFPSSDARVEERGEGGVEARLVLSGDSKESLDLLGIPAVGDLRLGCDASVHATHQLTQA